MEKFEAIEFRPDLKEILGPELSIIVSTLKQDPTSFLPAIQNMIHGKVIAHTEEVKRDAKREFDKKKEKILEKLPTKEELIQKFTSTACSIPAQKAMTRLYGSFKDVLDKAEKVAKPLEEKLKKLKEKEDDIKNLIRNIGEKLLKISKVIAIVAAIIVVLKAVIIAIGSIPPPFTVPFGVLFPIAQIVGTIEDIVDAFAAILIESLPQALADLGNMVIKAGLTIIALIGAINTLLATLDFIRKVLESLYLKYLNTCNIGDNSNDGTIVDDANQFINQSDDDINNYYDATLRALKLDGNEEAIEQIYNANFQRIGYKRLKL